MPILLFF